MPQIEIYIKKDKMCDWKSFKKICKRDGVSVSSKVQDFMTEYVGLHGDGNTQTKLDFADKPLCLPKYKTCANSERKLNMGTFVCLKDLCRKIPKACDNCKTYRTVKREG